MKEKRIDCNKILLGISLNKFKAKEEKQNAKENYFFIFGCLII